MPVWFLRGGRSFDAALCSALGATFVAGVDFGVQFADYVVTSTDGPVPLVLVVDVYDHESVRRLITCLRRSRAGRSDLSQLKVVLLSTFDTWGGSWSMHSILDIDASFRSRLPLASAYGLYDLETELCSVVEQCGVRLRIVGCGLLYGGDGLDLQDIFMTIWREVGTGDRNELILPCRDDAAVPIIRMADFISLVQRLVCDAESDDSTFIPAVGNPVSQDGAVVPFAEVIRRFAAIINGNAGLSFVPSRWRDCPEAESSSAWKIHVPFSASPVAGNLLTDARQVWAEFLSSNALQPVTILLAGPPRVGKSDMARVLAERLEIEAVTLESAVRFLLKTRHGMDVPHNVAQPVSEAYVELRAAVDAKSAEGKKPSKGSQAATPAAEEAPIDEALLTPAFCQALPADLLRRCLSAQVNLQPSCRRRGFVLDVWDGKVLTGWDTLQEVLNGFSLQPGREAVGIDFVVELHCPGAFPTERLVASQGTQAKSKEAQAALKALETQVAAYSATLRALPMDDGVATFPAHMASGLAGVVDILEAASEGGRHCSVCRIDCCAPQSASPEGVAGEVFTAVLRRREGCVGWLSSSTRHVFDAEVRSAVLDTKAAHDTVATPPRTESSVAAGCGVEQPPRRISEQLSGLDAEKRSALARRSAKLEAFLTANVLPQVAMGLVQIQREQPDDPILFLAEQLLQDSAGATARAQGTARQRFLELLRLGGF